MSGSPVVVGTLTSLGDNDGQVLRRCPLRVLHFLLSRVGGAWAHVPALWMELGRVPQLFRELPALVARQFHVGLI